MPNSTQGDKFKNKIILIVVLIILAAAILNIYKDIPEDNSFLLGSDRDAHGCIGSAGYTWCEAKNKCIRPWEEECVSEELTQEAKESKIQECRDMGGIWYPSNVCEVNQLSESECIAKGGEFNPCASACRHNPEAEVCTMQCVLTCTFTPTPIYKK
jgi:hypothetical protein